MDGTASGRTTERELWFEAAHILPGKPNEDAARRQRGKYQRDGAWTACSAAFDLSRLKQNSEFYLFIYLLTYLLTCLLYTSDAADE